jgi:hypothetical protein
MPRNPILKPDQLSHITRLLAHESLEGASKLLGVSKETLTKYLQKYHWTPKRFASYFSFIVAPQKQQRPKRTRGAEEGKPEVKRRLRQPIDWSGYSWAAGEQAARLAMLRQHLSGTGLTATQMFELTGIDRGYWRQFVTEGWVQVDHLAGRYRIPFSEIARLAVEHPELLSYAKFREPVKELFGLTDLPPAPAFKLITCHSKHIVSRVVELPARRERQAMSYEVQSCEDFGDVRFWAPLLSSPACPRCGVRTTRVSEDGLYTDSPGEDESARNALASKIGLRWREGTFRTPAGAPMDLAAVQAYVDKISLDDSRERERRVRLIQEIENYRPPEEP